MRTVIQASSSPVILGRSSITLLPMPSRSPQAALKSLPYPSPQSAVMHAKLVLPLRSSTHDEFGRSCLVCALRILLRFLQGLYVYLGDNRQLDIHLRQPVHTLPQTIQAATSGRTEPTSTRIANRRSITMTSNTYLLVSQGPDPSLLIPFGTSFNHQHS